jgi:hypothetical protein
VNTHWGIDRPNARKISKVDITCDFLHNSGHWNVLLPWVAFLEKPPDLSYDCWNRHVLFGCFPFIDVDGDAKIFQHENVQD